jgi:hypothetical protein
MVALLNHAMQTAWIDELSREEMDSTAFADD